MPLAERSLACVGNVMNDNWLMVGLGVVLIILGFRMTHVSGGMPGSSIRATPTFGLRVFLILFGLFAMFWGARNL